MIRSKLIGVFFFMMATAVIAQNSLSQERCDVKYPADILRFEQWLQSKEEFRTTTTMETYRIPVVVHILHDGEPLGEGSNLSKERVLSQIRVLNEDFRRMKSTAGYNSHPDGADTHIEFVLAKTNPNGDSTNGIVRVDVSELPLPPQEVGNVIMQGAYYSYWNPEHYLNIWSVSWLPEDLLLGLARFPESDLPGLEDQTTDWTLPGTGQIDGVAINSHHFGITGTTSRYNQGRTLTHEIGHFLGLFHIWGPNSLEQDGCQLDDFCADTPPTRSSASGCSANSLACNGERAMVENYMDYADDACMNIFTNDQTSRMRSVLENSPRRKSLLTSPALDPILPIPNRLNEIVKVYPNPASDHITISFGGHQLEGIIIDIQTINGQTIFSQNFDNTFQEQIRVNIPESSSQVIFLSLRSGSQLFRQRVILQ